MCSRYQNNSHENVPISRLPDTQRARHSSEQHGKEIINCILKCMIASIHINSMGGILLAKVTLVSYRDPRSASDIH